jgi:predicted nuclease of predicted toxin-antitoxin system
MKRLFDERLSRRLLRAVQDLFPGSVHGNRPGQQHTDRRISDHAGQNGFTIITADTDFIAPANTLGPPPKLIVLENCHYPMGTVVARPG